MIYCEREVNHTLSNSGKYLTGHTVVVGIPPFTSRLENEVPVRLATLASFLTFSGMDSTLRCAEIAASEYNGSSKKKVLPWPSPSEEKLNTP